jgi:hypothetical protein
MGDATGEYAKMNLAAIRWVAGALISNLITY